MELKFYAINKSYPEEVDSTISRKIQADFFIGDCNIGGLMDWGEIYQLLSEVTELQPEQRKNIKYKKKSKGVLHYLKTKL